MQNWAEFSAAVKRGATAGRLAGTVTSKQERKTRTGNKMGVVQFSDVSGQYEAVLFSEGLAQYRDLLEPGKSVVITVSAEDRPEGINLRIQTVSRWRTMASQVQKALRIFVRDAGPLGTLAVQLARQGRGAGELRRDQGRRRRARSRSRCPTATASRRRSPRRCARCRAWSRWSWCRARTCGSRNAQAWRCTRRGEGYRNGHEAWQTRTGRSFQPWHGCANDMHKQRPKAPRMRPVKRDAL